MCSLPLAPFKIRVGEREYVDLPTLNTRHMLQAMTDYNGASTTACPSPEEWAEYFLLADNVFAFTISSNLSGSYNAAIAAREMVLEEHPEKNIFVLDTLSCSGALAGAAELANKLIGENQTFEDICFALQKFAESTHILFALASFDNLAKNGRVNRVVGFIAGRLNMRVLGRRTSDGRIDFYFKTRGETRVLAKILEQMVEDGYDGVHPVLISECGNQTAAQLLHHGIEAKWPGRTGAHCPLLRSVQLLRTGSGHYYHVLRQKYTAVHGFAQRFLFCWLPLGEASAALTADW